MFNKTQKTKSGFSILELVIVMAIIAIMSVVIFANRGSSKAENDVTTASRQVAAQIRALQNESLNGKQIDTNGDGVVDKSACDYYFDASATTYSTYYYDCAVLPLSHAKIVDVNGKPLGGISVDLSKQRVRFSVSAVFDFQSPRGTSNPAFSLITLKSKDDSITRYICVSSTGNVTEQATNVCS